MTKQIDEFFNKMIEEGTITKEEKQEMVNILVESLPFLLWSYFSSRVEGEGAQKNDK